MRIVAEKKVSSHLLLLLALFLALYVSDRPESRINRPTRDIHRPNDRLRYNAYGPQRQPFIESR
jgi:hypothetical protein